MAIYFAEFAIFEEKGSPRSLFVHAIQKNDVDIDHRGLAYAVDRVGTPFILEYTGGKGHPSAN